jgi:hypothetical protein
MRLAGILIACCVVLGMFFPQLVISSIERVPWQKSRHPQFARLLLILVLAAAAITWALAFGS